MKRTLAIILTLAMLLSMVGTVAVAADEALAKIPEFTATVGDDGTVTVTLDDGVTDYTSYSFNAYLYKKGEDQEGLGSIQVELEYDSSKKAYIGKNEEVAGGTFDSINIWKGKHKANEKGTAYTQTDYSFNAHYYEGKLTWENYDITKYNEEQVKDGESYRWVVTSQNSDEYSKSFSTENGKLTYESHKTIELTGDKDEQKIKANQESKGYDQYQGNYTGKSITEEEITRDGKGGRYNDNKDSYELSRKTTSKSYNEEDVLTESSVSEGKTTYNAAKDGKTYDYSSKDTKYSTKGYTVLTTKKSENSESKLDENKRWRTQKNHSEETRTNRDGILAYSSDSTTTYKDTEYTNQGNTKYYNTYTKALVNSTAWTQEFYKNKETDKYEYSTTSTDTYNNDDGSLRRKIETTVINRVTDDGYWQEDVTGETHYNKDNNVVAKYTYDTKKDVGTWVDGSGNVIGKNEKDEKTGAYTSQVYGMSFKKRTGELDSWTTVVTTKDSAGTTTKTTTSYDEGKKSSVTERVTKKDNSYKEYKDGVLRQSYEPKDSEYKYYDIKGTLSSSSKWDSEKKLQAYYDNNGKLIRTSGSDKDNKTVTTYYDPETGKVTKSTKTYSDKDGKNVTDNYNEADKLVWSQKSFYDKDLKTSVTGYYDGEGKEFARTFNTDDGDWDDEYTSQYRYNQSKTWKPEEASGEMEKYDYKRVEDYRKMTETKDYTKWTVSNGTETAKRTRKDQTITTWDNTKREENEYVGGTLVENRVTEFNDYYTPDNWENGEEVIDYQSMVAKETTKRYDWYTGKQTESWKNIYSDVDDDPVRYYKYYDKYSNLQVYGVTDDTDSWDWSYSYYANGAFKGEHWYDYLDYDNEYSTNYYLDGTLASESKRTGSGKTENGRDVSYNKDGSWAYWADTINGVTNAWLYNSDGEFQGYEWNEKNENGIYSYEKWDAAGNLTYNYSSADLAAGYTRTRTDAAGNKWESVTKDDKKTITLTLANKGSGWQYAVGEWFYVVNGEPVKEAWKQIDGSWYYFDSDGMMSSGLIAIEDKKAADKFNTYAANDDGSVTCGWVGWTNSNGDQKWAYTDANGEVLTGWQKLGGQWYYFTDGWYQNTNETLYKEDVEWKQSGSRGVMATGAVSVWNSDWTDKHTYFFNEDGTWDNSPGWKIAGDGTEHVEYHYYNKNGVEVTGWTVIDGEWYYFNEDGVLKNGWVKSGPNWYFMDPEQGGAMAADGWAEDIFEGWYYLDKNGNYKTGWLLDGNTWYYLKADGAMAEKEWAKSGSDWYYMDEDGAMATGWVKDHDTWYYLKADGAMKTGWVGEGNTWYYLDKDGAMVADTDVTINGTTYHFDETGLCTNPY